MAPRSAIHGDAPAARRARGRASRALVAQRHARCQEPPNIGPTNLQVSKQGEGEEQDEEPTKALGLTIPQAELLEVEQVVSESNGGGVPSIGCRDVELTPVRKARAVLRRLCRLYLS